MAEIYFEGRISASKMRFISELASFCADRLIPKNSHIMITFKAIRGFMAKDGFDGAISLEDEDGEDSERHSDFLIEFDSGLSMRRLLSMIAHEMVHLKQYALGELSESAIDFAFYKWHNVYIDHRSLDYWDRPWEIEAYGRELGLLTNWIARAGYKNKYAWSRPD